MALQSTEPEPQYEEADHPTQEYEEIVPHNSVTGMTHYLLVGSGINCSAMFGKYGYAGAIKKYRQPCWEISVILLSKDCTHHSSIQGNITWVQAFKLVLLEFKHSS